MQGEFSCGATKQCQHETSPKVGHEGIMEPQNELAQTQGVLIRDGTSIPMGNMIWDKVTPLTS